MFFFTVQCVQPFEGKSLEIFEDEVSLLQAYIVAANRLGLQSNELTVAFEIRTLPRWRHIHSPLDAAATAQQTL